MGSKELKQIIISKENAVFWMDNQGHWQNEHGPIEHPRIIKYFNACIRKDTSGYFVHQKTENSRLQQQVTALRGEKTALDMQLIELERRMAEVELQVGVGEQ